MIMSAAIRTLLSLLLLNKIAALSVSRFDERDIRNENDFNDSPPPRITNLRMDPAVASSDWPLRLADVEKGVTFTRTISKFPTDAAFVISLADDDCKQHDVYGDNECHFSWGQNVTGNFKVKFSDQIEEGDFIVGDFKVRIGLVAFDLNEFVHIFHLLTRAPFLSRIVFSRSVSLAVSRHCLIVGSFHSLELSLRTVR
jgi:hypothetical protein